jgi:hypothetical protein
MELDVTMILAFAHRDKWKAGFQPLFIDAASRECVDDGLNVICSSDETKSGE